MVVELKDTQADFATIPASDSAAPWWRKPLLLVAIGSAAALMLAWLFFLGWLATLVLSAVWP